MQGRDETYRSSAARDRSRYRGWAWAAYLGEDAKKVGIRANVASYTRHHPNVGDDQGEGLGKLCQLGAGESESVRLGFDAAIMLDPQGYVSECTGQTIPRAKSRVLTPSAASILEGIHARVGDGAGDGSRLEVWQQITSARRALSGRRGLRLRHRHRG